MDNLHNAINELRDAISRVEPLKDHFQKLDFKFEIPLNVNDYAFGVLNDSVCVRFGPDGVLGYKNHIGDFSNDEIATSRLEKFLGRTLKLREYLVVDNGIVNREALNELKEKINSNFIMVADDAENHMHIKLTQISMREDTPEVKIFFKTEGSNMLIFDRLDNKSSTSRVYLYLKPED